METKIENHNGVNTVVVEFQNTPFNANSRVQLRVEDAAELFKKLHAVLWTYQAQNESEFEAIKRGFRLNY